MKNVASRLRPAGAALLLATLPLLAAAQRSTQDSLLRRGELVGGRPHAGPPRRAAPTPRSQANANADPGLSWLLHENIALNQLPASQLPDLYDRFLEATRAQRRQWSAQDWDEASATLGRLNTRYEAVRLDLPLEERLSVRTSQGEFRTLQGARHVKDRLDERGR